MEQIPKAQLERLEHLLQKESHIPFTNKLLSDGSADKLNRTWLNKSWNSLLHSDLVEAADELHYRRLLKDSCNEQLPRLREDLEENEYQALIMDLVDQEYAELEDHGSMNALYLLEMACELSRLEGNRPAYMELLNLIKLHRLEYGTLEKLRNKKPAGERFQTRYLQHLHDQSVLARDGEDSENSAEVRHFKQVVNGVDNVTGFDCFQPPGSAEEFVHDEVIRLWREFEERVVVKVSNQLNNSDYMRKIKKYLWQRQEQAETIFDETIASCTDPDVRDRFREKLIMKRPQIRNGMASKISARPEIAEKIYDILERLVDAEISAFDFLNVFCELSKAQFDGAICEIQIELENNSELARKPEQIIQMLDSFDVRSKYLSSQEKYELSQRQHAAFR